MTTELLAMLGGGASGFIFKLIGTMVSNQQALTEGLLKDKEHLTTVLIVLTSVEALVVLECRRFIVIVVLFGVVVAPFLLAHSGDGVTVASDIASGLAFLKVLLRNFIWICYTTRNTNKYYYNCIVYFGSSTVK